MKITSQHIPIGFHTIGRREPFIFVRRNLTREYFSGEMAARLKVRNQEICVPKDGVLTIGSSAQKDDIYINDKAVGFGQIVIKAYEAGLIVMDERSGVHEINSNSKINIKLDSSSRPLMIEVLMGKPREGLMPMIDRCPPVRQTAVEALIEQERSEPAAVISTAKEALSSYRQELAIMMDQLVEREKRYDQYGKQSILAGVSFLTATTVGSLVDSIMVQLVSRFYFGLGVASSFMIVGGIAIKALNHHLSQSRIAYLRDRLQDRFADRLRQFSSEEIAELIAQQEEPARKELEKMVEIQLPTRSEQILMLAERQSLSLPPKKD